MPGLGRSKRRNGRRVARGSRPYLSRRAKAKTQGRLLRGSKRRRTASLAAKAKGTKRLRSAVVANAKALDAVKEREFGYWQTTNSVLGGATPSEHMGTSYNFLEASSPVMIHLNNLHSVNGVIPPDPSPLARENPYNATQPFVLQANEQAGACHLLRADPDEPPPGADGLVRKFTQPETFAVNGVLQKRKRTGPYMYPQIGGSYEPRGFGDSTTPLIPIPNGKKLRWGGVDLQFHVEGALQDTQFDFYIVKCNKEKPLAWDPWHQTIPTGAREVPGVLPYTINDFQYLHQEMYPKKLPMERYTVLQHSRFFMNNVHRVTGQHPNIVLDPDNAKYATGNTWSHTEDTTGPHAYTPTHRATTPMVQKLRMNYAPNKIVRPLRNFIGERVFNDVEKRGTQADANPLEPATLGTMSWDNFHPSANVWLVMTTNHKRIETPKTARELELEQYIWPSGVHSTHSHNAWATPPTNNAGPMPAYGPGAADGVPAPANSVNNNVYDGQNTREYYALLHERARLDAFRNPRIHIFRRTWWQDEHIPTEMSESQTMSQEAADIQPDGTEPATPEARASLTPAKRRTLEEEMRHHQTALHQDRSDPRMGPIDTTSTKPADWAAYPPGHSQHSATAGIPTDIQARIDKIELLAGACDFFGIDRRICHLTTRALSQVHPPDMHIQPLYKGKTPNALTAWGTQLLYGGG